MPKPRKRIYLINRDFQLRYSYAAAVVGIMSTILTVVVLLIPLYTFEILRIPRFLPLPILATMLLAALLNICMVGLVGVLITHRIAGPMYSLVRAFRRIESGHWAGKLRLRENDDMKFVARNFNELVDGLIRTGKQDLEMLLAVIAKLESRGNDAEALQMLHSLKENLQLRLHEPENNGSKN